MPVTFPSTNPDIATMRALIDDPVQADETAQAFTDDALQALLDLDAGAVRLAAANALDLLAGRLLTVESDQIKLDGSKQAATLQARANALRAQHYEHGGDFYFDQTSMEPCNTIDGLFTGYLADGDLL